MDETYIEQKCQKSHSPQGLAALVPCAGRWPHEFGASRDYNPFLLLCSNGILSQMTWDRVKVGLHTMSSSWFQHSSSF